MGIRWVEIGLIGLFVLTLLAFFSSPQVQASSNVNVSISPENQENSPGETLEYTVTVTNTGVSVDNYLLENVDTENWSLELSSSSVGPLGPDDSENVTLEVTIPASASPCTWDNITVIARSQENFEVSGNAVCRAHAVILGFDFLISVNPEIELVFAGDTQSFEVTVTNEGDDVDSYTLEVISDAGWDLELQENRWEDVGPGEQWKTTFSVTVPKDAEIGSRDDITVIVLSDAGLEKNVTSTIAVLRGDVTNWGYVVTGVGMIIAAFVIVLVLWKGGI